MAPLLLLPFKLLLKSRLKSFAYALNGLKIFFNTQINGLMHLGATIVVIGAGLYFDLNYYEWCVIIIAIAIVFITEIINTSIEFLTNLISPEYNRMAGKVKDLAAAAVLLAALIAATLAGIIFIPKF